MFWRFSFALVLVLLPATAALAQNLTQEAGNFSARDFSTRWLNTPSGWWVYYEVPATSQTQPTIRRYVQATDVTPAVTEKALTQDDIASGLQFYGSVGVVSQFEREFDLAKGWLSPATGVTLATYLLEKRNDQWKVISMTWGLPSTARFRKPMRNELPKPLARKNPA
jgi:hypothetical protein